MRSIIIIGPKKTGTTSLYHALRLCEKTNYSYILFPKESNYFINRSLGEILSYSRPFIDVSPQYFTSFRSLLKIKALQDSGFPLCVIQLKRDPSSRNMSHVNYMVQKQEISAALTEPEVECLCLSNLDIPRMIGLTVIEITVKECAEFLESEFGFQLFLNKENESGYIFRFHHLARPFKMIASTMRKSRFGALVVEVLSKRLRLVVYKPSLSSARPDREIRFSNLRETVDALVGVAKSGRF
jgi:hypothetical protein